MANYYEQLSDRFIVYVEKNVLKQSSSPFDPSRDPLKAKELNESIF